MKLKNSIPFITTLQMIEVDRLMVGKYNIKLIQMMENAGRNLADLALDMFLNNSNDNTKVVVILAGTGGNGGGALVCARHLHNRGIEVVVCITRSFSKAETVTAQQLKILQNLDIKIILTQKLNALKNVSLIIDGIIGYGLTGKPKHVIERMIVWANQQKCKKLSLDVPTGVNTTSGGIHSIAIKADATMTLALPKTGLKNPSVSISVGELFLADISVPPELYREDSLNIEVGNIFEKSEIIKIY